MRTNEQNTPSHHAFTLICDNKATYEACPESKDKKVLNMYNIFNLQKRHCEWIACT